MLHGISWKFYSRLLLADSDGSQDRTARVIASRTGKWPVFPHGVFGFIYLTHLMSDGREPMVHPELHSVRTRHSEKILDEVRIR